jgi:hypothetical protein
MKPYRRLFDLTVFHRSGALGAMFYAGATTYTFFRVDYTRILRIDSPDGTNFHTRSPVGTCMANGNEIDTPEFRYPFIGIGSGDMHIGGAIEGCHGEELLSYGTPKSFCMAKVAHIRTAFGGGKFGA